MSVVWRRNVEGHQSADIVDSGDRAHVILRFKRDAPDGHFWHYTVNVHRDGGRVRARSGSAPAEEAVKALAISAAKALFASAEV
jgi:hypothetical protein